MYLNSKYFFNQNLSQHSRNSGEFLWYIISRKNFENNQISKKRQKLPKLANNKQ